MHSIRYVAHSCPWEWFVFFIVFATTIIMERAMKQVMRKKHIPSLPKPVRIVLTFAYHVLVYALFFLPPLERENIRKLVFPLAWVGKHIWCWLHLVDDCPKWS